MFSILSAKDHRGSTGHSGQLSLGFNLKRPSLKGDATFLQRLPSAGPDRLKFFSVRREGTEKYLQSTADVISEVRRALKISHPLDARGVRSVKARTHRFSILTSRRFPRDGPEFCGGWHQPQPIDPSVV
jgi:hypothetical protein